jgi:hypothetical protein
MRLIEQARSYLATCILGVRGNCPHAAHVFASSGSDHRQAKDTYVPNNDAIFYRANRQAGEWAGIYAPDVRGVFRREREAQGEHGDLEHFFWIDIIIFYDFHLLILNVGQRSRDLVFRHVELFC